VQLLVAIFKDDNRLQDKQPTAKKSRYIVKWPNAQPKRPRIEPK
jgi:hypothetical protein